MYKEGDVLIAQLAKIAAFFPSTFKRKFVGVFLATVVMGLIQVAGIGALVPFVSLLVNRERIFDNPYLSWIYDTIGFGSSTDFLLFFGVVVLLILVLGNVFTAFAIWVMNKFAWSCQVELSSSLLQRYLEKPYEFYINRNTSDIGKNVLFESMQFTLGVLMPSLMIAAHGLTAVFIVGFLLWLKPIVTLLVVALFGVSYGAIYLIVRRPVEKIGKRRFEVNSKRFKLVDEAFGTMKEVKILGRESALVDRYTPIAKLFAGAIVKQNILSLLPRYIVETILFSLVVSFLLYVLHAGIDLESIVPIASGFAFAGYRLLPTMQSIYGAANSLRFNRPVLDTLYDDYNLSGKPVFPDTKGAYPSKIELRKEIILDSISYSYPDARESSINNISMIIKRNTTVAFVGKTGAGKTTLADIILGLLRPQHGVMFIDGQPLTGENIRAWQTNIGYVPQNIYLLDGSIAENIAYGEPDSEWDWEAIERAAKAAHIHELIITMPHGYESIVGERGVKLSGGQRQRIGIARALYKDPAVLVLDEATSALDGETERQVHLAIKEAAKSKTVIIIAHRLETVRDSDCVFMFEKGSIAAFGKFEELTKGSAEFRAFARSIS